MSAEIYFTSDTHFDHSGALRFRPQFTSVEEMNETIIQRWNGRVKPGDRIYHLGDFGFFGKGRMETIRKRLVGQVHLIQGNHDDLNIREKGMFVWVGDAKYLKHNGEKIFLFHYACRTWRGSHRGSWHLYGHSHGNLPENDTRSFDVGVDAWDFNLVHFDEVEAKMATKPIAVVEHHPSLDMGDDE